MNSWDHLTARATISGDNKVDNGTDVATGGSEGLPQLPGIAGLGQGRGRGAPVLPLSAPLSTEYQLPCEVKAELFPAVGPCASAWTSLQPLLSLKEILTATQDPAPTSAPPPGVEAAEALPLPPSSPHLPVCKAGMIREATSQGEQDSHVR